VSADVIETLFIEVVVTQVLIILIQQWLKESRAPPQRSPRAKPRQLSMSMTSDMFHEELANKRQSYQVINSALSAPFLRYIDWNVYVDLLRIVRKGPAVKNTVDEAIDRCAIVMNLRDSIEEERILAEQATEEKQKRIHVSKGKPTLSF
jgi:hypothetical protein